MISRARPSRRGPVGFARLFCKHNDGGATAPAAGSWSLWRATAAEAAYATRLLVQQMKDVYFREDIKEAINQRKVKIKANRGEIRQYEPCEFRLEFRTRVSCRLCQARMDLPLDLHIGHRETGRRGAGSSPTTSGTAKTINWKYR